MSGLCLLQLIFIILSFCCAAGFTIYFMVGKKSPKSSNLGACDDLPGILFQGCTLPLPMQLGPHLFTAELHMTLEASN